MSDTERFGHVEIEINSVCDVNCPACDRYCDVAPCQNMTLAQVRRFVDESIRLDWPWVRMHILGGEPTLHPQFAEIARDLMRLRAHLQSRYPESDSLLRVLTNGRGRLADYHAWLVANEIHVAISPKDPARMPDYWDNMWTAPVDVTPGLQPACAIFGIRGCGIGLTRHGFFLCGAGASIARVCGLDIGVQRLDDLTMPAMLAQADAICRLCAHKEGYHIRLRDSGPVAGPFWADALARYRAAPPPMTLYGETK
ncbi:MAG TPA: radical SAM protein [Phycisphaerae bacterium]|nr:radical SAM protein [Phycisphaerae bacterium]